MAIEITGLSTTSAQISGDNSQVTVARQEATVAQQQTGRPMTTETVTLTDMARQLQSIEQSLRSQPVVDGQRVEIIKQSLTQGQYDFNAQRVAEKFIRLESRLAR